jgi:hypothetical protein
VKPHHLQVVVNLRHERDDAASVEGPVVEATEDDDVVGLDDHDRRLDGGEAGLRVRVLEQHVQLHQRVACVDRSGTLQGCEDSQQDKTLV